jgi:hypothetical protein
MQTPDTPRPGERLFALLMVVFAGFVFWESYGISGFRGLATGGIMPMLASGVMVVTSFAILSDTLRRARPTRSGIRGIIAYVFPLRVVLFALLIAAYAAAIPSLGFIPASGALLFIAIWGLWDRGPLVALALALPSIGAIYVPFRVVFQVVLPGGSLWQ